jgi:hypothetical protein
LFFSMISWVIRMSDRLILLASMISFINVTSCLIISNSHVFGEVCVAELK